MHITEQKIAEAIRVHGVDDVVDELNQIWEASPKFAIRSFGMRLTPSNSPDTSYGSLGVINEAALRKNQVLAPEMLVRLLENGSCEIRIVGFHITDLN